MHYDNLNTEILDKDIETYKDSSINKLYAILCIYEDCESKENFEDYFLYTNRIIKEFSGVYQLFGISPFFSIVGNLQELRDVNSHLNHDIVKSIVFHCISEIKKAKVVL